MRYKNGALAILANSRIFGNVLCVRFPPDDSVAVRCEKCQLVADYPQVMLPETKEREVRAFIRGHAECKGAEEQPAVVLSS